MKKFTLIFCLFVFVVSLYNCSKQTEESTVTEVQKQEMRKASGDFMMELKSVLIREIQNNGIVNAVSVCSDTAQIMTNNFGIERGIFIKRVSFKNRNENNFPDEYESKLLREFETMKNNGELNETSESIRIISKEGTEYIKYMKPIFMQAECLNCHGALNNIVGPVREIINTKYPEDKAHGYAVGDLRGAVSVQKLIE